MGKRRRQRREREERKRQEREEREKIDPSSNRPSEKALSASAPDEEAISPAGKRTIGAGIAVLILGFVFLTLTDPYGRNWASTVSPLLILGAYVIIAYGIFLPDGGEASPSNEQKTKEEDPKTS